jgi:hypothetical protein
MYCSHRILCDKDNMKPYSISQLVHNLPAVGRAHWCTGCCSGLVPSHTDPDQTWITAETDRDGDREKDKWKMRIKGKELGWKRSKSWKTYWSSECLNWYVMSWWYIIDDDNINCGTKNTIDTVTIRSLFTLVTCNNGCEPAFWSEIFNKNLGPSLYDMRG